MHVVYFAQDLADAAVARRVRMLTLGGAKVTLIGFRRTPDPIPYVEDVRAFDLGETVDGKLVSRLGIVLRRTLDSGRWRDKIATADAIVARNLDMCTIADAARRRAKLPNIPLIYECLDIHHALLGKGVPSKLLLKWERTMLGRCAALMVSSEGFLHNHFNTLGVSLPPVILAENKRILLNPERPQSGFDPVPPWRIGWFGILRCVKSFEILRGLAQRHPDLIDIDVRGKPTPSVQTLIDQHLPLANMRFGGTYVQDDLATMYQKVHLTWALDYFQQGQNSDWLLPNRLYEGGYYNRPAIALANTQTATWLKAHDTGVIVRDPESELDVFFVNLTVSHYRELQHTTASIPSVDLIYTADDCRNFTARIAGQKQIDNEPLPLASHALTEGLN